MTAKVEYKGFTFDRRTADALKELDRLTPDIPLHFTQGSYHDGPLSSCTHSGGGAVDISVHGLTHDQIIEIITIANELGFEASWWRTFPEWTQGDHIHMILTGAPDLCDVALNQIKAVRDGFNGLGHLGRSGPDRHKALRIKGRTWERYLILKQQKAAAAAAAAKKAASVSKPVAVAAAAATAAAAVVAAHAPAPAPKPAVVKVAPAPKPSPAKVACSITIVKGKARFAGTCKIVKGK